MLTTTRGIFRGLLVVIFAAALCALVLSPNFDDTYSLRSTGATKTPTIAPTMTPTMPTMAATEAPLRSRVGVIGAAGYVGSALSKHLRSHEVWDVVGYDRHPMARSPLVTVMSSDAIETDVLQSMAVVVFLGGVTTRKECEAAANSSVMQENVVNVEDLITRMKSDQYLIFASTGAIAEGSGSRPFCESDTPNVQLLDCLSSSLLARERMAAQRATATDYRGPVLVALRFGSVVGTSPVQRMESAHVAMTRHAMLRGEIPLFHPETWSAFLSIHDQVRAIETIMLMRQLLIGGTLNVFNIVSFNSRIGQAASEVAQATGARIMAQHHPSNLDIEGFSLSGAAMESTFGFHAEWTPRRVAEDLADHLRFVSHNHLFPAIASSSPAHRCRKCGSDSMITVLNLGDLPSGDCFQPTADEALKCPRRPLKYMQCRKCEHIQLAAPTDALPRCNVEQLTTAHYEAVVAHAVGAMPAANISKRSILVVSCGGHFQLADLLIKKGWLGYGLCTDSTATEEAYMRGVAAHKCESLESCPLPDAFPRAFEAIAVSDVLENATQLQALMSSLVLRLRNRGILYCDFICAGLIADNVLRGRFNYFTARSLQHLAAKAGLRVVDILSGDDNHKSIKTAVLMRQDPSDSHSNAAWSSALQMEELQDNSDAFIRFGERAAATREWLNDMLQQLYDQGHDIVAYGVEHSVFLNYMLDSRPTYKFLFAIDDRTALPSFCPGTAIAVRSIHDLANHSAARPLAIVFLGSSWGTRSKEPILAALKAAPRRHDAVWMVSPFPFPQLVAFRVPSGVVVPTASYAFQPTPRRRHRPTIGMVSHFYNEEMMMPYWVLHHAHMFDEVVVVDHHSTDKSAQIFREYAPSSWRLVNTTLEFFDAVGTDQEVAKYEHTFVSPWRVALTTTEFIIHPDLASDLINLERDVEAMRLPSLRITGNDSRPLLRFESLIRQRSLIILREWITQYSRFVHRLRHSPAAPNPYSPGRHGMSQHRVKVDDTNVQECAHGWIAKFAYSPWPECLQRKLQIGKRIPKDHFERKMGTQHNTTAEKLAEERNASIAQSFELTTASLFADAPQLRMALQALYSVTRPALIFKNVVVP